MVNNILPSIFASNFADIPSAISKMEKANIQMIHYDIMDNHFVPNISFGLQFTESVMKATPHIKADIHLMIDLPGHYEEFLNLKPYVLTIHLEAGSEETVISILRDIRSKGVLAGLSIKPKTPVEKIKAFLGEFDLLLIMSVEPGFSFQKFISESHDRIRQAREICGEEIIIEADGGINRNNMGDLKRSGLDWFVMGGGFFNDPQPETLISELNKIL